MVTCDMNRFNDRWHECVKSRNVGPNHGKDHILAAIGMLVAAEKIFSHIYAGYEFTWITCWKLNFSRTMHLNFSGVLRFSEADVFESNFKQGLKKTKSKNWVRFQSSVFENREHAFCVELWIRWEMRNLLFPVKCTAPNDLQIWF